MISTEDRDRLKHILEAIGKIERYTENVDFESFEQNEMLQDAIFKNLEVIGEAAYRISPDTQKTYPNVEWRKIAGLRHRLVHDYYQVDLTIVWNTKSKSLPVLENFILEILEA